MLQTNATAQRLTRITLVACSALIDASPLAKLTSLQLRRCERVSDISSRTHAVSLETVNLTSSRQVTGDDVLQASGITIQRWDSAGATPQRRLVRGEAQRTVDGVPVLLIEHLRVEQHRSVDALIAEGELLHEREDLRGGEVAALAGGPKHRELVITEALSSDRTSNLRQLLSTRHGRLLRTMDGTECHLEVVDTALQIVDLSEHPLAALVGRGGADQRAEIVDILVDLIDKPVELTGGRGGLSSTEAEDGTEDEAEDDGGGGS